MTLVKHLGKLAQPCQQKCILKENLPEAFCLSNWIKSESIAFTRQWNRIIILAECLRITDTSVGVWIRVKFSIIKHEWFKGTCVHDQTLNVTEIN